MGHPSVMPVIVVLAVLLVAGCIDAWRFKTHYVITFPLLISMVAYQGMQSGIGALQESLTLGFTGTGILLLFFALGGATGRAAHEASVELRHYKTN